MALEDRNPRRARWLMWPLGASTAVLIAVTWSGQAAQQQPSAMPTALTNTADARLTPTAHLPVPPRLEAMWYVPEADAPTSGALANLARGIQLLEDGASATEALPLVSNPALSKTSVADYARYYAGIALMRLERHDEADAAFAAIAEKRLQAQLPESAMYRRAEIRELRKDFAGAAAIYEDILSRKPALPQVALVKLGAAALAAGDSARAIASQQRVLREFPTTAEAADAEKLLESLNGFDFTTANAVAEELGRAEMLFRARRYDRAQDAFNRVRSKVDGEDAHRVTVRLAQIQAAQGQHRQARETFRRYTTHPTLGVDAQFGLVTAARAMGDHREANSLTEDFVARYPDHHLAEQALNEMARQYVLDDDDETAAKIYTRMVDKFPAGVFAERGAWKAGWWAYREKNFAETIRIFERGVANFPRSDYRPPWLYWSARAYEQSGDRQKAIERYRLVATDYLNSYYGRLAWQRLEGLNQATVTPGIRRAIVAPPTPPANLSLVQSLISAGLYRPALNELQYAQRVWGDSSQLQATIALVHNKLGNLRLGISAMRRAYPQFMAAGGEDLPQEILRVIFPLDYWPLLQGNAQAHGLDPFIVAALAAQESTFDAKIRSSANAIGLMQIIPPTGRRLARQVGVRNFTERTLENPEINARLGTKYFGDMVKEFGGYHFALAGYNAGEHRVRRWNSEAPGLPQDEWIDNIPYPETQNYVKRILGTAEDYRRLYGEGQTPTAVTRKTSTPAKVSAPAKKTAPAKKAPARKAPAKKKAPASKGR